jgi:membrane associated rhomboid family serine protease
MDYSAILTALGVPAPYVALFFAVVGVVSAAMTVLPHPKSTTGAYATLYGVLNFIAMNFLKAKNAQVVNLVVAPAPVAAIVPPLATISPKA